MKWMTLALLLLTSVAQAEVSVDLISHSRLTDDDAYQTTVWYGVQISYHKDDSYLFISQEQTRIVPIWGAYDLKMTGLGVGITHELTPYVRLFAQVGYYFVSTNPSGRHDWNEGLYYYFNSRYGFSMEGTPFNFDSYLIEVDDTIAASIGIEIDKPITGRLSVGFSLGYRSMRISEYLRVDRQVWLDAGVGWWEQGIDRNFSSLDYAISFNYKF